MHSRFSRMKRFAGVNVFELASSAVAKARVALNFKLMTISTCVIMYSKVTAKHNKTFPNLKCVFVPVYYQ